MDPRSLFPLPLTPFEAMMLHDDRASHPMTCAAEFSFEGRFHRPSLEAAVAQACQRHPLFSALVAQRWNRRWDWIAAPEPPTVEWVGAEEPWCYSNATGIDLRVEPGLRLSVQERGNESKLLCDFHHACSDGVGGLSFIEDIFAGYVHHRSGRAVEALLPPIEHARLLTRGRLTSPAATWTGHLRRQYHDLCEIARIFGSHATPLAAGARPLLRVFPAPAVGRMSVVQCEPSFLSELRWMAVATRATVNDLLLQALFASIGDWNRKRGTFRPHDMYRVLVPVSVRESVDLRLPATNRTGYCFLNRTASQLGDPVPLLRSIADETSRARSMRSPQRMLEKVAFLHAVPGGLPLLMSLGCCMATAAFSNVGDPTRRFRTRFRRDGHRLVLHDVRLNDFRAITPVRPLTRAVFFVNTYGNRLTLAARLDPLCFHREETEEFLRCFAGHLQSAVQAARLVRRAA